MFLGQLVFPFVADQMLQLLVGLLDLLTESLRLLACFGELLGRTVVHQGWHQCFDGAGPPQALEIIAIGSCTSKIGGQFQVEVGIEHGRHFAQQGQGHQGPQRIGRAKGRPVLWGARRHRPLR